MSPPEVEYQHRSVSERIRSKESVKSFAPNVTAENLNAIIRNDDQIYWKVLVPKKLIVMSFQEQGNPKNHRIHKLAVFNIPRRPATSPPTSCEKETHQPAPSPAPTNSALMNISMRTKCQRRRKMKKSLEQPSRREPIRRKPDTRHTQSHRARRSSSQAST
ncbi:hypothetical protein B9Z55_003123 [Caenorhabditis nigoni]|uniref:Uncharacterized protein n=1 Tax=Caenorhabditis nigoni TaxID=1611254 RepID=A0A2G5VNP8_9PELO|nr:hypothetical protein B9Z55_003123 [Caenorhabditis nigoni]